MTRIVVLISEDETPQSVRVIVGDAIPEQAQAMCLAATRYFQVLAGEAETKDERSLREPA